MLPIRLIAPSYGCSKEQVDETCSFLLNQGFEVSYNPTMLADDPFCAAPLAVRRQDFRQALLLKEPHILWPVAGGYGAMDVLDGDLLSLKISPHLLVGFSDTTSLHALFNGIYNLESIHGCCARHLILKDKSEETKTSVLALLRSPKSLQKLYVEPYNKLANDYSTLEGVIVGGNLTLVQCSLSTPWQLNLKDKILYLEEVDERGYRVDRLFLHLYQAGVFKDIKALILGDFTQGLEADGSSKIEASLRHWRNRLDLPIFRLKQTGHDVINRAFFFNKKTTLVLKA
jgi:muramoyltetrapeptide carboxypeptidase